MRKYLIGGVVGFLLASAIPAYGAVSSLIGKKVQNEYTVYVDGVALDTKAIAIDGTSYTPNRALSDALGFDIEFKDKSVVVTTYGDEPSNDGGEGPLPTTEPGTQTGNGGTETTTPQIGNDEIAAEIAKVNQRIESTRSKYDIFIRELAQPDLSEDRRANAQKQADKYLERLQWLEAEKARLEALL